MSDDKSVPKPGHFLPGGAGDGTTVPEPPSSSTPSQPGLSKPEPLSLSTEQGHAQQHAYGWSAARGRTDELPAPPPFQAARRFSKPVIAGFAALALLVVSGGVALAAQLIRSYDDLVENPLSNPSVRTPSASPSGSEPSPTAGQSATPTPDALVVKQNKLYATGKLVPSKCKEPSFRPTSKRNVELYYQATLRCLNISWGATVREAGHAFHPPRLKIYDDGSETLCGETEGGVQYCDDGEGWLFLPWQEVVKDYPENKASTRVYMAESIGYVYAVHVQKLAGIWDAYINRRDQAPAKTAALEEERRLSLQADCFAAAYTATNKAWFPLQGRLLTEWKHMARNQGDEFSKKKIRDSGSRKSVAFWSMRGFNLVDLKYCNTFAAPPAQVT